MNLLLILLAASEPAGSPFVAPPTLGPFTGLPGAEVREGGTWLPIPLDNAVGARLRHYYAYPAQCQARIDGVVEIYQRDVAALELAKNTECTVKLVDQEAKLEAPIWPVLAVGAGALVVGLVVGAAFGGFAW